MAASLDDIVTTLKNGVTSLTSLANSYANLYNFTKGTILGRGPMSTGITTIYTVPVSAQITIQDIEVCNTAGGAGTFSLYLVASGGTASIANALFSAQTVAANTTFQWKGAQVITAGMTIQASGSATTLTLMVSGGQG